MSHEQDASRRASELRAGRVGDRLPKLNVKSRLRFLDLLARNATNREINMKMQLSPAEIAAIKADLNVVTSADIVRCKDKLERGLEKLRRESMLSAETCDAADPFKQAERDEKRAKKEGENLPDGVILNSTVPRMENLNRNRNVTAIADAVASLDDDDPRKTFEVPSGEEKSFLLKLHLGVTYWAVHYNVPKCIILKEILRMKPDVNLDLLHS